MARSPTVFAIASLLLATIAWATVHRVFGQAAGVRAWRVTLLLVLIVLSVRGSIPLRLGSLEANLTGAAKWMLVAPVYAVALAVSVFPHELACAIHLKGYLCS